MNLLQTHLKANSKSNILHFSCSSMLLVNHCKERVGWGDGKEINSNIPTSLLSIKTFQELKLNVEKLGFIFQANKK